VDITLENKTLTTCVHAKLTNNMKYLHYSSSHPYHTKNAIHFSFALRGQRLNSTTSAAGTYNQRLQEALVNQGYPYNLVTKRIRRASSHTQPTQTSNPPVLNPPTVITQFHSKLTKVKQILNFSIHVFQSDAHTRSVFPTKPRLVFQHPVNLRNILVRMFGRELWKEKS